MLFLWVDYVKTKVYRDVAQGRGQKFKILPGIIPFPSQRLTGIWVSRGIELKQRISF